MYLLIINLKLNTHPRTPPRQISELAAEKRALEQALAASRAEADALRDPAARARGAEATLNEVAQRLAELGREADAQRAALRAAEDAAAARDALLEEREATLQQLGEERQALDVALRRAEARAEERGRTLVQAQESISELQGTLSEVEGEAAAAGGLREEVVQLKEVLASAAKVGRFRGVNAALRP